MIAILLGWFGVRNARCLVFTQQRVEYNNFSGGTAEIGTIVSLVEPANV